MRKQAERWGAELYPEDVESLNVTTSLFTVQTSERKVIIFLCFSLFFFLIQNSFYWLELSSDVFSICVNFFIGQVP